ncbi:MAG TPA: HD domain-containing phosphohydrolase, partial [Candidatus Eisenbacteria bacterium]|nr:HD domain-containing phosphohydrolase [Candidatus Eisenbacteria bacterium]
HRMLPEEVPLLARIVTVADAFDAMTSDRVYRLALTVEDAVAELERHEGRQFDSQVVRALCRLYERGELMPAPETVSLASGRRAAREYAKAGVS